MNIKVAVLGAGKMGQMVLRLLYATAGVEVVGVSEKSGHPLVGQNISGILGITDKVMFVDENPGGSILVADVAISFATPEASLEHIREAAEQDSPIVVGTTGFTVEQLAEIKKCSEDVPIVLAPNMSVGVNLLFKALADIATVLDEEYDVEIVETHHRHKTDAPSGTALKMAQVIAEARGKDLAEVGVYERHGNIGERAYGEIGIQTLRVGDVVGEHTVIFGTTGERIEVTHKASSREVFARGAVRAIQWVMDRQAGLYTMRDVLGLR